MKHLNVAYATMSDYYYICVSMVSAIQAAAEDTFYDFAVLGGADFTAKERMAMRKLMEKYPRHSLTFYDVSKFNWCDTHTDHIAKATYYRLALPLILEADRCLYLDGDTIVCQDLQTMYGLDFDGCYVAGVRAPGYYWREYKHIADKDDLPLTHDYINAGVQMMNLDKMRQDRMVERFMQLMHRDLQDQDQDTMNAACYGRIKHLPFQCNMQTKYASILRRGLYGRFTPDEMIEAYLAPVIIHYADRVKPWNNPAAPFADKWWDVCKSDKVLYAYFRHKARKFTFYPQQEITELEPFFAKHDEVYCYGAGDFGGRMVDLCQAAGLKLKGIVVSDGQCLPRNSSLPVRHLSDIRGNEVGSGIILAMREAQRQGVLAGVESWGNGHVLSPSDGFFLEMPMWTYTYQKWKEAKAWHADNRPLVTVFLPDAECGTAEKFLAWQRAWPEVEKYKWLTVIQEEGEAHEALARADILSLALPYRLLDPPYQEIIDLTLRDTVSTAQWLKEKLSGEKNVLFCVGDRRIDMGERLGEQMNVPYVLTDWGDECSKTIKQKLTSSCFLGERYM